MGAKLIAAGAVLQMSADELRGHIEQELSGQPRAGARRGRVCPVCRSVLVGGSCRNCGLGRHAGPSARGARARAADGGPLPRLSAPPSPDDDYDPCRARRDAL